MLHVGFAEFTRQSGTNDFPDGFREVTPDARGEIPKVHQVVHVVERPKESPELNSARGVRRTSDKECDLGDGSLNTDRTCFWLSHIHYVLGICTMVMVIEVEGGFINQRSMVS